MPKLTTSGEEFQSFPIVETDLYDGFVLSTTLMHLTSLPMKDIT